MKQTALTLDYEPRSVIMLFYCLQSSIHAPRWKSWGNQHTLTESVDEQKLWQYVDSVNGDTVCIFLECGMTNNIFLIPLLLIANLLLTVCLYIYIYFCLWSYACIKHVYTYAFRQDFPSFLSFQSQSLNSSAHQKFPANCASKTTVWSLTFARNHHYFCHRPTVRPVTVPSSNEVSWNLWLKAPIVSSVSWLTTAHDD